MKKYIFILFIALLVSSDSLWAYSESLMPNQSERELLNNDLLNRVVFGSHRSVRELLENGANVNYQSENDDRMALMIASFEGHIETVKLLLANGADPDLQDNNRQAALMYASQNGHIEIVKLSSRQRWQDSSMVC